MKRVITIVLLAVLAAVSAAAQSREARTVKYAAKDIVLIKAKLRYTTLIVLPQNEKILDFVTGDKDFWVVEGTQNFCYIKPAKQGISTDVSKCPLRLHNAFLIGSRGAGTLLLLLVTKKPRRPGDQDPIRQDIRKREYTSRFASSVSLSYRPPR